MKRILDEEKIQQFINFEIIIDNEFQYNEDLNHILKRVREKKGRGEGKNLVGKSIMTKYRFFKPDAMIPFFAASNFQSETPAIKTEDFFTTEYEGEIANFPKHIVEAMLDNQEKAGNPRYVNVFEGNATAGTGNGGFDWAGTKEGNVIWSRIVNDNEFHLLPTKTTEMTEIKDTRFPFRLSPENQKKIIGLACHSWMLKLIELWGQHYFKSREVVITQEFYKEMRCACTTEQHMLFDEIFGKDEQYPPMGTPCLVKNYLGWILRYANGLGEFFDDGSLSGSTTAWKEWRVLDMGRLPVVNN